MMKITGGKVIAASLIAVSAVTVGALAGIRYWGGSDFLPTGESRALRRNQVVFEQTPDSVEDALEKGGDDSSLWKKDLNSQQQDRPDVSNNADFLFQAGDQPTIPTGGLIDENTETEPTKPAGEEPQQPTEETKPQGPILDIGGETQPGDDPTEPTHISGGDTGGNTGGSTGGSGEDIKPTEPSTPTEPKLEDPKPSKVNPTPSGDIHTPPYQEDMTPNSDDEEKSVVIMQFPDSDSNLYIGQTVDEKTIYCNLYTYVRGKDGNLYLWDEDDLNKYVRIEAVSFDGGKTWVSDFPVTIPEGLEEGQMRIRVGYRLSTKDSWTQRVVTYNPVKTRVLVLKEVPEDDSQPLENDNIINYNQYPEVGSQINLLQLLSRMQDSSAQTLSRVFTGWTEDGKYVPWYYPVTSGRHVLLPGEYVDVPAAYQVQLNLAWLDDNYQPDYNGYLCYVQSLTGVDTSLLEDGVVQIPRYVQGISAESWGFPNIIADRMVIPDTVFYLNESSNIWIGEAYEVDENNAWFASGTQGTLMNKAKTRILAIPNLVDSLTVPASVAAVDPLEGTSVTELVLEAKTTDMLPTITFWKMESLERIVLSDDLLVDYMTANAAQLEYLENLAVYTTQDPDTAYTIQDGAIVGGGALRRIVRTDMSSISLTEAVHVIRTGAAEGCENLTSLTMPADGSNVVLEKDSLAGSGLKVILCMNQSQADNVRAQLAVSGAPADVEIRLPDVTKSGYQYLISGDVVRLISTPENVTAFDGTVTTDDGAVIEVTEIGDRAFQNRKSLRWVTLGESLDTVGIEAFRGCTALEGVVIKTRWSITLKADCFADCANLRFIGSNAQSHTIESNIENVDFKGFCLDNSDRPFGWLVYNSSAIGTIDFLDLDNGDRMLYAYDYFGTPFVALRSGVTVPQQLNLPVGTSEIAAFAFQNVANTFYLNWEQLTSLVYIDSESFENSGLSGDIRMNVNSTYDLYLGEGAFSYCTGLTSAVFQLPEGRGVEPRRSLFAGCSSLKSVDFGEIALSGSVSDGMFSNCSSLTDITISNSEPPTIETMSVGLPFQWNLGVEPDVESSQIRVHVESEYLDKYIGAWRYAFTGYANYGQLYRSVAYDPETGAQRTEEEAAALAQQKLLEGENRLRKMLGAPDAAAPGEYYQVRHSTNGILVLTDIPKTTTELYLDAATLGLPEGWTLDYVGTDAAANAPGLTAVHIPATLVGLYDDAFSGNRSGTLDLYFEGTEPLKLELSGSGVRFSFGSGNIAIHVPAGAEQAYLDAWTIRMTGYESESDLRMGLWWSNMEATEEEINQLAAETLLSCENELRAMMGMEPREADTAALIDENPEEKVETDIPEETEKPEETEATDPAEGTVATEPTESSEPTEPTETTEPATEPEISVPTEKTEETEEPKQPDGVPKSTGTSVPAEDREEKKQDMPREEKENTHDC